MGQLPTGHKSRQAALEGTEWALASGDRARREGGWGA